ncbi:hypothetical protein ZHAS_00014439 [Anopheles sinensis]|uniref:Uncharacterized protein n=1 Tax=Anopheles sinensis TaxID=74873 RepID=A0A084W817_ANOSI|nr:hypothetical protein ZHAS_00014439 [Anopheles sinensis]
MTASLKDPCRHISLMNLGDDCGLLSVLSHELHAPRAGSPEPARLIWKTLSHPGAGDEGPNERTKCRPESAAGKSRSSPPHRKSPAPVAPGR